MDAVSSVSDDVPQFKWWYRWVGAGALLVLGLVSLTFAIPDAMRLVDDLRTLPPVISAGTGMATMLPLGIGMLGASLFFLFPPVLVEQARRARGELPRQGIMLRTKAFVAGLLLCLALSPILNIALREGTGSYLERFGYIRSEVDQPLGTKSSTLRRTRLAAA